MSKLPASYYQDPNVVHLAKDLLGKKLCTFADGQLTTAMIVETEAYEGIIDKASHAFGGRHTERTSVIYREGGISYVYFCYGMHYLFNVVTNIEGHPHAILIRGVEPLEGIDMMLERRGFDKVKPDISNGPGKVCKALGIDKRLNGESLLSDMIWIEPYQAIAKKDIIASPRVGVDYAKEHALWPYRFRIKGNRFIGK